MDHPLNPQQALEAYTSDQMPAKPSRRSANDCQWEAVRPEIYQLYVVEKNTLKRTMAVMQEKHNFRRSERKYKDKLKEWKMDKYLSAKDMEFIASKNETRSKADGKETVFYNNGIEISAERIRTFKKRNGRKVEQAELDAATPENITYHTPSPGSSGLSLDVNQEHLGPLDETLGTGRLVNGDSEADHTSANSHHFKLPDDVQDSTAHLAAISSPIAGERTDNMLEKSEALAKKYKHAGRWEEATREYLQLLDEHMRCEGSKSLSVAKILSQLGHAFQAQKKFDESVRAYRKAVATFEVVCGHTSLSTLQTIVSLAKVYEESGDTHEAKLWYAMALHEYETIRGTHDAEDTELEREMAEGHLECLLYFGDFLCENRQHIVNSSHTYGHHPLQMFKKAIELAELLGSNRSLMIAYGSMIEIEIERSNFWSVRRIMAEMHILLNIELEFHFQPTLEVLMEGIHLASIFSDFGEWDTAGSIFDCVLPKLDLLDDQRYEVERSYGYLERAETHYRQGNLAPAKIYFQTVEKNLCDVEQQADVGDAVTKFVGMRNIALKLTLEMEKYQLDETDLSELLELGRRRQERTRRQEEQEERKRQEQYREEPKRHERVLEELRRENRIAMNTWAQEATGIRAMSTALSEVDISSIVTSHKYGKTFSESDITGIDLSEFYGP